MVACEQPLISIDEIQLEIVPCDFCGNSKYKILSHQKDLYVNSWFLFDYYFPIVQCRKCGLIFVNPRPTKNAMKVFYPDVYHDERRIETMAHRYEVQARFLPILKDGGKILDIGCAKGDFLHWLSEKNPTMQMYGCDAYSTGVRNEYSIHFTPAELPDCHYPNASFDCITAWAVLEHVHSPKSYFYEIARVIKPEHPFVFVVPNFNSLMCRVAKGDDIVRHIFQFTPKSIVNYLSSSGFQRWNITFDDSIFDGRGTGSIKAYFGSSKVSRFIDKTLFTFHWEKYLKIGGTMVIIAWR